MILETVSKQYQVIRLLREGEAFKSYLCSWDGKLWIADTFEAPLAQQLFPYFMDLKERETFEDLADVFSWHEMLVVVLACHEMDQTLGQLWEQEHVSSKTKLRLLEGVLTGCCIRELPLGIAADVLKSGNAGFCSDGIPGFYYDLHAPRTFTETTMEQVVQAWNAAVLRLFAQQLRQGLGRELAEFCREEEKNPPDSLLELYQRFLPVKEALEQQIAAGKFTLTDRSVQAWQWLKKGISLARKAVVAAVLLGAAWVLLRMLFQSTDLGVPAFESIGTVLM